MNLYQELFDYLSREHDVLLLEQDLQEIIDIVEKHHSLALIQNVDSGRKKSSFSILYNKILVYISFDNSKTL